MGCSTSSFRYTSGRGGSSMRISGVRTAAPYTAVAASRMAASGMWRPEIVVGKTVDGSRLSSGGSMLRARLLRNGDWLLVVGHWPLVLGRWSLVVGRWSLVLGRSSLVIRRLPFVDGR